MLRYIYYVGSKASEESNPESDEIIKADKTHDEPDLSVEGPQVDIITTPDSSAETDSAPETAEVVKTVSPKSPKKKTETRDPEPEPEITTRKSSRVSQRVSKRVQEKVPAKKESLKKKAAPPSTRAGSTRRSVTRKGKA